MGKCRYKNEYGFVCGQQTSRNQPLCALHAGIVKMKEQGIWEDILKKSKDKDYDPYEDITGDKDD